MRFSIFTPTHDVAHLARAARSVAKQYGVDHSEVEWIIVTNGDATVEDARARINLGYVGTGRFPSASIHPYPMGAASPNIGALKRFAAQHAKGDVLVELDHDDELTPDALEVLDETFDDPEVDFAYSDWAEEGPAGEAVTYGSVFETYCFLHGGSDRPLTAMRAWPPSPAAFSRVQYAPNHLRAWRRAFYEAIGGHDPSRAVCDDHDLVIRSYLKGNVVHLPRCLYIYHRTGANTSLGEKNALIQTETLKLHDPHAQTLVERWCDLQRLPRVDLCSGAAAPQGWVAVDKQQGVDLDVAPWPFADSSIGAFRAHDALEHLRDPVQTMKEIHRCLVPGGWLLSLTPSTDGRGAWQDPTHVSWWNSNSFWYYTRAEQAKYIGTPVRFQLARLDNFFPSPWHKLHNIVYTRADLICLKDGVKVPGPIDI